MLKRTVCILIAIASMALFLGGCNDTEKENADDIVTMSYWVDMGNTTATVLSSFADSELYKKMEEITGVKMTFIHPPAGQGREQFNLMIASRDLPDLIEYAWGTSYPGGAEKAINDGMIIKLNDLIDQSAPNYKSLIESDPTIEKQVLTDDGSLYSFPAIGVDSIKVNSGPLIRKDLLDKLSIPTPETIDEWEIALSRMKNELGVQAPLTGGTNAFSDYSTFSGAFGVGVKFYLDNGVVRYGPLEPGFREYIETMHEWYQKGLIDPDFLANDRKTIENMVVTGKSAAVYGAIGSGLGVYMNPAVEKEPGFNMVAAQFPVKDKGDVPRFAVRQWEVRSAGMLAITTVNQHPDIAVKWADYFYSKEGNLLKNFGIEGLTYTMEADYPKYTDLILKNPDGLSISQAISKYTRASTPSPGLIDKRYHEQYYDIEQQKEAMKLWDIVADEALATTIPPVTPTNEETERLSVITSSVNSYVDEMLIKFILGTEPMGKYDEFLSRIKSMEIDAAIKINQDALARYIAR